MSATTQIKRKVTNKMSKSETPSAPTTAIPLNKTYKYFDLDSFEKKSVAGSGSFTPAATMDEAAQRINGDQSIVLTAINAYLQKQALKDLKRSVLPANAGNTAVLSSIMKPFRAMPPYSAIGAVNAKGEFEVDRKKQTEAILSMIKGIPQLVETIKTASAGLDDDEEQDDEE